MVRNTILFAPGLQVRVSVALPDPSLAANEIVSGFSVQVTFGFVRVDDGRITAVYATPRADATAAPTRT